MKLTDAKMRNAKPREKQYKLTGGRGTKMRKHKGETLFIDARTIGTMIDRVHRELTDADIDRIADTYHRWRGDGVGKYEDVPGLCKSASTEEIEARHFVLRPGRYVGAEEVEDDDEPFGEKMARLVAKEFKEGAKIEKAIRQNLRGLGHGGEATSRTLGDYFTLQRGKTYKSRLPRQPSPVLLGLASIHRNGGFRRDSLRTCGGDCPDNLVVHPGELSLSLKDVTQSSDLLGAVARLPLDHPPGRLSQETVKLEPKRADAQLNHLYWFLRTPQYRSYRRAHATGTTNLGLAEDDFLAFPAPEPNAQPLEIVSPINALDDKSKLNRRMIETLEVMARSLFKSWFVDFDPVRAKSQGETPPGMDPATAALFPSEFEDSELGEIPKGWRLVNIEQVADVRGGKQLPTEQRGEQGRCAAFGANGVMGHCESATHEGFVIAFGRVGAYCGSIHWLYEGAWISNKASAVVPNSFDELVLQSMLGIDFPSMRTGSAQPFIPNSALSAALLLSAPDEVLAAFCGLVRPLRIMQASAQKESDSLARLRDALLPRLLSGELAVGQAEQVAEATA